MITPRNKAATAPRTVTDHEGDRLPPAGKARPPAPACPLPPQGPARFDIAEYCRRVEQYLGDQEGPSRLFWQALSFAVTAHQDQRRKSGEAYISHPLQVALILLEELDVRDPEILAAAVLHDTIEDVPEITTATIGEMFGPNVEATVEACTKISGFSGDRQNFYKLVHRKLFSGAAARLEVMLIKIADRLHNLRTLESMPRHKRQKIAEETLNIYAPLAKVMGLYAIKRELYNLALTNKFPRQSHKVNTQIAKLAASEVMAEVKRSLEEKCRLAWVTADIRVRPKGLWAYFDAEHKVLLKSINHPMEIEIVTNDIQNCYRVLGLVDQHYPPIPRTIRDFIANPKSTGYQGLHVRANIKGQHVLFKIKTPEMQNSSRAGLLRGWTSRGKGEEAAALTREVREMFDLMGSDESASYQNMIAASGRKEIYTYTPKGELMVLPKQSVVLDFAFKVHTDIGKRCVSAMVGQEKVGPEHVLQDGEQVSIITQKDPVRFEPGIQHLCQTPKARAELAKLFRARRLNLAREIGSSILRQELKRYGVPPDILDTAEMGYILIYFGAEDLDELFQALGEGRLRLKELMFEIIEGLCVNRQLLQPPTGSLNRIFLSTLDPACVKFSRCCNPLPVEGLYGLLSERGLSVHRKECRTMAQLGVQREDVVEVRWNLKATRVRKPQTLLIMAAPSRNRVLMMLSVAPEEMHITDIELLSRHSAARTSAWQVHFSLENLLGLKHILQHLAKTGLAHEFVLEH